MDRDLFSDAVTSTLRNHPLIEVRNEEVESLPEEGITVVATGPLTSPTLSAQLKELMGEEYLYFFTMRRLLSWRKIPSIWTRYTLHPDMTKEKPRT